MTHTRQKGERPDNVATKVPAIARVRSISLDCLIIVPRSVWVQDDR